MKPYYLLLLILAFCTGCSSSLLIERNSKAPSDVSGRRVLILAPPENSVTISNPDEITKLFPKDKRPANTILKSYFCQTMYKMVRESNSAQGQNVFSADSLAESYKNNMRDFFIEEIPLGKDTKTTMFFLPTKEWLVKRGKMPDIVVVINSLAYSRGSTLTFNAGHFTPGLTVSTPHGSFTTGGSYVGGSSGSSEDLLTEAQFIMYDYVHDTWITCGKPEFSKTIAIWGLTSLSWRNTFEDVMNSLIVKSPWENTIDSYITN